MRKLIIFLLPLLIGFTSTGQILEFDQLEMRYDQKQYKAVYRKAKRLLDKPDYDFSFLPRYYLTLSQLQLAQNERWYKRNQYAVTDALETFKELKQSLEGKELIRAHAYELSVLKSDLKQWMYELKRDGDQKTFDMVEEIVNTVFEEVPEVEQMEEDIVTPEEIEEKEKVIVKETVAISDVRKKTLALSNDLLGVPYKWAGNTPKGFDCSGFTCYLANKEMGITLNRRAEDQYKAATKVKRKNVKPGDFVFFDNGSGISHVGVVYSTNNNSIQMIHASTSVGISIVDIYQSSYWKKRIAGFGTYFED
ncbi:C40 family peptidase [Brumimicrobium aurantiacum]|uniref:NlpC/P60 family protein n=1 Tax=Brumimicrobium aurantiacum TaxID=1737063 RepID=A0A3E1EZ91_9FLAO|nr:C40 family peptidase [Brumimicrobium aurantiacum]RFC54890.1 NlpC/P60 family protein [Brumimicrobium aurantiacum]